MTKCKYNQPWQYKGRGTAERLGGARVGLKERFLTFKCSFYTVGAKAGRKMLIQAHYLKLYIKAVEELKSIFKKNHQV